MDAGNEQLLTHTDNVGREAEVLLADLRSGLDALRSLLSEIDAREAELGLDTLRSIVSQLHAAEPPDT